MRYKTVKMVDHEATGSEWRKIRESHGVSLRNLAQIMGVSAPYLSDLERGRRNWTDEVENKYASALDAERVLGDRCTCHERDSSHACPKCYAEGCRGHMDPQLVEFDSVESHWVEGRGLILVVKSDRDGDDFENLYPHVMVDDEPRRLLAVEAASPVRKGDKLGLVVKPRRRRGRAFKDP